MKIAILGGTGDEGFGLGYRWASAGHEIIIGSRLAEKGEWAAAALLEKLPDATVSGTDNKTAAARGEIVVLSVPYEAQKATLVAVLEEISGKLLISVVVPLTRPKVSHVWQPETGSAAQEAQAICGESTRVVAAFQTIAAKHLVDSDKPIDSDVLICGPSKQDKLLVASLAEQAGMRGIDAGPLQNAVVAEGLAAVLIGINIRHKVKDAGFRITGLDPRDAE
ncbi:MAG: NADPH-dependent F420 reductase [Candidatus Promineifilaceae bacterium]